MIKLYWWLFRVLNSIVRPINWLRDWAHDQWEGRTNAWWDAHPEEKKALEQELMQLAKEWEQENGITLREQLFGKDREPQ